MVILGIFRGFQHFFLAYEYSLKPRLNDPNISPNIYPTLMLGGMLDRFNIMLGHPTLTCLMLG